MNDASHVPSGVLIVKLISATGMFAARAERVAAVAATPAAIDSATKSRRERSSPESRPVGCRSSLIKILLLNLSELFERRLRGAHAELAGRFDVELRDDAVLHDHRETLASRSHSELARVELEAERARVLAVAVREHQHFVAHLARLAPGTHHEHVVHRHAGDRVDSFLLDRVGVRDEARQMLGRAGRRERAGHGEQHDLLAAEELFGREWLGTVRAEARELPLRHLVSYFDGHRCSAPRHLLWRTDLATRRASDQRLARGAREPTRPSRRMSFFVIGLSRKLKGDCRGRSRAARGARASPGPSARRFDTPRPFLDDARSDESSD